MNLFANSASAPLSTAPVCSAHGSSVRSPSTRASSGTRRRRGAPLLLSALVVLLVGACGPSEPRDPAEPTLDGDTYRVEVLMKDMRFDPDTITVPDGANLVLEVENVDGTPHDLVFETGETTDLMPRGDTHALEIGTVDGQLDGWCSITGHREAGMILTVTG